MRKKTTIIMFGFPFIFLVVLSTVILLKLNKNLPSSVFTPFVFPTPTPYSQVSSRWATDSGLLQIENKINNLEEQLGSLNLQDSSLFPPQLEFGLRISP